MTSYLSPSTKYFIKLLTACSSAASTKKQLTTNLIEDFKSAGLEAEKPTDLEQKEFGNIKEEGKRILIPSLGENAGFMFFSHTYSKGNFLLQINGEMKGSEFEKYKKVMDEEID
ncbi:stress protein [Bacillus pumilus]|uniref:stress protein n=1 Tax=Bacillus pumilus TaxID=1408 RepID=UPI00273D52E8|nr:stress protein [Bacillus pumilus]WLP60835.1 stress protein [Bacillus pumilus]